MKLVELIEHMKAGKQPYEEGGRWFVQADTLEEIDRLLILQAVRLGIVEIIRSDPKLAKLIGGLNLLQDSNHTMDFTAIYDSNRLEAVQSSNLINDTFDDRFDSIVKLAATALNCQTSLFSIITDSEEFYKSFYGMSEAMAQNRGVSLTDDFCKYIVASNKEFVVNEAITNAIVSDSAFVKDGTVGSYLGCPITSIDKQVIGALCVFDPKSRQWTQEELGILKELANLIMLIIRSDELDLML